MAHGQAPQSLNHAVRLGESSLLPERKVKWRLRVQTPCWSDVHHGKSILK